VRRDQSERDASSRRTRRSDSDKHDISAEQSPRRDSSEQDASSAQAGRCDPGEQETPRRDSTKQSACSERPPRRDLIYAEPVDVRLADGRSGVVRHPPFDGRVRVVPPADRKRRGCAINVPLDDLAERSRIALAKARVRRRIEVRVRCSSRLSCPRMMRGWLTADGKIETIDGEPTCSSRADLFNGRCPEHRRRG
jgi:hypothetical protein